MGWRLLINQRVDVRAIPSQLSDQPGFKRLDGDPDDSVAGLDVGSSGGIPELSLSIVVPAYNEERTIICAVREILAVAYPFPTEILVVDDGSRDSTLSSLESIRDPRLVVHRHPVNLGKGAAVRTGIARASGTHLLIFDADLEYDPRDILNLVEPIRRGRARVVYGSRIHGNNTAFHSLRYALGGRATTWCANVLFNSYLQDLHTCLKLLPLELVRQLELTEPGFGLDTEITAKLLSLGIRPLEVPISYYSRSHAEGKKLNWRHGVECLRILARIKRNPLELDGGWAEYRGGDWGATSCAAEAVAVDHPPPTRLRRAAG